MFTTLKKVIAFSAALSFMATAAVADGNKYKDKNHYKHHRATKNVIVLIPDGCDESVQTLSRWYKGTDAELAVDRMQAASMKIHMANSVITGSAAASTAFATGHKTTVRFLGVGPRTDDLLTDYVPTADPYAPVASVLEAAKLKGKATGLVATSRITHATPAGYASHIEDRGWDNDIMEHMVYNNIDVAFGGGARHLISDSYVTSFGDTWGPKRTDGENLMQVLKDRGYQFVDNKEDMFALTSGKVWGLFDDSHLDPDMDREALHPTQPSLAEMTEKAIELLSQNRKGFFLMVEGSQVDWAGHNNDPAYMVNDFLAFDKAVQAALDFAERDGNTIVLAFPDHNTGGMTIGNRDYNGAYTHLTYEELIDPLKGMTMSSQEVVANMADWSLGEIKSAVETYWNLVISDEVAQEIFDLADTYEGQSGYKVSKNYALARVISKHYTAIGWTSHGHDGGTVPIWAYGIDLDGTLDNTEIAQIIADAMNVNLDRVTKALYVDIRDVSDNYEIEIETTENGDAKSGAIIGNGVLRVGDAELPISKDYMTVNGKTFYLPGVTVYASGDANIEDTVYISKRAVRLLSRLGQL